jgi:5'-methylthioadenosine phosphorylase
MVTDYDCWREGAAEVEVSDVLAILKANATTAARMLVALASSLPEKRPPSPIDTVLDYAIVTPPEQRDQQTMSKLEAICRRVLQADRG